MKYAFTADIHIKKWNDKEVDENGVAKKTMEILGAFNALCAYCKKNDIPEVIIGGDINDTKGIVHAREMILFKQLLELWSPALTFHIIPGNHDYVPSGDALGMSAVSFFENMKNVHVYHRPTKIDNISFVPWTRSLYEDLAKEDNNDILISHFGLSDASLSNGMSIRSRVSSTDLNRWKLVLLGDYHKPQQINHVYYPGSLIPLTRAEADEEKRFLVFDSETLEVESVKTEGYRKYMVFEVNEETENITEILNNIKQAESLGHFVVVKKNLKEMPAELFQLENVSVIDTYEEETIMRGITSGMEVEEQMKKFVEIENIPEELRELYISIGMEAISEEVGCKL